MPTVPATCPSCGAALRADPADPARRVCSGCGARYAVGAKKPRARAAPAAPPAPANVFADMAASPPPEAKRHAAATGRRSGPAVGFMIGGAAVILLGVVAVVGVLLASRMRTGAPPTAALAQAPQATQPEPSPVPSTTAHRSPKGPATAAEPTSREKPAPPPSQKAPPVEVKPAPVPDDPAVPGLVAKLKDPDLTVRINAVNELAARGQAAKPALPALIDLLKNPPPIVPKPGTDVAKEVAVRTDLNSALVQAIERIGLDPAMLPSLLQGLKGGDRNTVTVSALLLALLGDQAVDPLLELLKDKDPQMRLRAIRALAFSREVPDRAVKPLIERLDDDNEEVRTAAPAPLVRLGPRAAPAIPALIKGVQAKRPLAAATLGMIGPLAKDAVPALREALADQDTIVTSPVLPDTGSGPPTLSLAGAAAFALGQMGADAAPAVPDLIKALGHKRADDRTLAVQALGRVGVQSPEAVAALGRVLADDKELPPVRLAVVEALGKLGEPGAAPLIEALKAKQADIRRASVTALAQLPAPPAAAVSALVGRLRDEDPTVRTAAATTLGEIGERAKDAAPELARALAEKGQPEDVVKAAGAALARLGDSGTAALVEALKDKQPAVRRTAAGALGDVRTPPPSAVSALAEALADDDAGVRAAAADSLGHIGPRARSALPALEQRASRDANDDVRRAAAKAVAGIKQD